MDLENMKNAVNIIDQIMHLILQGNDRNMLWEYSFIKMQIDKREDGGTFNINDHIRGMLYSLLSAGVSWREIEGNLKTVDVALQQYDPEFIMNQDPYKLPDMVRKCGINVRYDKRVSAIVVNTKLLVAIEKKYGSVDAYYKLFITEHGNVTGLIARLSESLVQMGPALTAEYLRNVGYDVGKPDMHLTRILGEGYLGYIKKAKENPYEVIEAIYEIALYMGKHQAEVDNILWLFCADGYGICNSRNPICSGCAVKDMCKHI